MPNVFDKLIERVAHILRNSEQVYAGITIRDLSPEIRNALKSNVAVLLAMNDKAAAKAQRLGITRDTPSA